jgi:hypothetical protein
LIEHTTLILKFEQEGVIIYGEYVY